MKIKVSYFAEKHDAKVFRLQMKEKGFTYRSLGMALGLSHAFTFDLLNGRNAMSEEQYNKIKELLGE